MRDFLAQCCGLGIICGIALCLTPEGAVKRIMALGCTAMLILIALQTVSKFDQSGYSLCLARYRELGKSLTEDAERKKERLSKRIVEQEYEEYLAELVSESGVKGVSAEIELRWSEEGFWLPYRVVWQGRASEEDRARLASLIEAEFGLGGEGQEWIDLES